MKQEIEGRLQPGRAAETPSGRQRPPAGGRDPRQVCEGEGTAAHPSLRELQERNSPELTQKTRPVLAAPGSLPGLSFSVCDLGGFPFGSSLVMAAGPVS